jgi:hypothetical protein
VAIAASAEAGGQLAVVSAGLGVRNGSDLVPPYSLTVAGRDPDSIWRAVTNNCRNDPSQWWAALNRRTGDSAPLATLIGSKPETLFVVALPSAYMQMVSADLATLGAADRRRVRLIGPTELDPSMASHWNDNLMPYDSRLDGAGSPIPGTRSDFSQRAARHFVRLLGHSRRSLSAEDHATLVRQSLEGLQAPVLARRPQHSDLDLREIIRELVEETGGKASESLRRLRHQRQIACEQGRFKRLFWEVVESEQSRNA